ncbi:MAG: hypothetical protein QOJ16_2196 [Acidobacteriota bacterium]|nr:hypothetical protein [Acidobacteriota bacterium]
MKRNEVTDPAEPLAADVEFQGQPGRHPSPELLAAYERDELSPREDQEVRDHLLSCRECVSLVLPFSGIYDPVTEEISDEQVHTYWRTFRERELLEEIGRSLPRKAATRYRSLITKRGTESLTAEEYAELLQLTDWVEKLDAKRLESVAELARLRRVSFESLVNELGIRRP